MEEFLVDSEMINVMAKDSRVSAHAAFLNGLTSRGRFRARGRRENTPMAARVDGGQRLERKHANGCESGWGAETSMVRPFRYLYQIPGICYGNGIGYR